MLTLVAGPETKNSTPCIRHSEKELRWREGRGEDGDAERVLLLVR